MVYLYNKTFKACILLQMASTAKQSRFFFFPLARSQRCEVSEAWILAREMRELHTPYGREARKKRLSAFHASNSF